MISVCIVYFIVFFLFSFLLLIFFLINKKDNYSELTSYPIISVLIAARNEEHNILKCLSALSKLNYPPDKIEVLIGDDNSEDGTAKITEAFIKNKNNFRLISVKHNLGNARGKANVLAHLAKEARGEYFFITDADIEVPENWIQALLSNFKEDIAIVSGVTMIKGINLFARLQSLEWIFAFGMVKVVSDLNIPVSAVGNNMAIRRTAYEQTGGYESIPFSVTEDFELFKAVLAKGWKYKNLFHEKALAFSAHIPQWENLLKQRKRWMAGAFRLPFILVCCLFTQSIFLPVILLTLILSPWLGFCIWLIKIFTQQIFILLLMKRIKQPVHLPASFILFELYSGLLSFALLIYYVLPVRVEWKGRKY